MISLRSEVLADFFEKRLDYSDKFVLIGSCFAENIGQKLLSIKIPTLLNPFGVLYNPVSVNNCLSAIINESYFSDDDLHFYNEKWMSFSHHGIFSNTDKQTTLKKINEIISGANKFLKNASVLFITFGTAWVYKYKKTNQIVSNCHKIPSYEFEHFILELKTIIELYYQLIIQVSKFNPRIEIVFTVSPVRHWKDGPINNQLSKSLLIVSIHELIKQFENVHYYPSYEIMMDDLRDYRFYSDDLFHPNDLAIAYIWEKFSKSFLTDEALLLSEEIERLNKNLEHKVFYPQTEAYKKFILSNLSQIKKLQKKLPELNFNSEEQYFVKEGKKFFPKDF